MRIGARVVHLLSGIIHAVAGVICLAIIGGKLDFLIEQFSTISQVDRMGMWILTGVIFLLSLFSFGLAFQHRHEEQTIIHQTPFGEVQITLPAVESLALRSVKAIKGVRDAHVGIRAAAGLLDVFVEITAHPDLSVPQISEEIRSKVYDYIFETVGIRVNSVKVLVTKVTAESSRSRVE